MELQNIAHTTPHQKNFVMIPRHEYALFSKWRKSVKVQLDEAWFWTAEWQKKEAEANEDIRAGRIHGPFSSRGALLEALKGRVK